MNYLRYIKVIAIASAMAIAVPVTAITRIKVSADQEQKITGFGAAALWHLMAPMADTDIINYLYGEESAVGLNIMRMEIGPQLSAPKNC